MRKQLLGTTAAIIGAGALSLGFPAAPTQGAAWKSVQPLPFASGSISEVAVASTGDGDAVAAAIVDGGVYSATAVDGVWGPATIVRAKIGASAITVAANDSGEAVLAWKEPAGDDQRVMAARQTGPNTWKFEFLSPGNGATVVGRPELAVAGNGRAVVAATIDDEDDAINNQLVVTEWPAGAKPGAPKVISASDSWNPSLDVNEAGMGLLSFTYTGLNTDVVNVARRSAAGGWFPAKSTHNSGDVASATDVAIADNGQGQVIYSVVKNGFYVAESARILPDGTVQDADFVGPFDEYVYEPTVDMNADGSALFAWVAKKNGLASIRYATAANASTPGTATTLPGSSSIDVVAPEVRIGDNGLRVIQYSTGSVVTTQYRTSPVQPFSAVSTAGGTSPQHALDIDLQGNAVTATFQPAGQASARFLDAAGPVAALMELPQQTLKSTFPVEWTAFDALSTVLATDVYATTTKWNSATPSAPAVLAGNVAGNQYAVTGALPGTTYCLQVRPKDGAGNATTTAPQCTTIPLDDKSLVGTGWNRHEETGNFRNTLTTTQKQGRVLTRTGVVARRLALVVKKVVGGGTIRVRFDGEVIGNYSLADTGKKQIIELASFPQLQTGTVKITVTSADGKPVNIDGLVVGK